jgi:hypothetical protein
LKKTILLALSVLVFALATGGEYANILLESKIEADEPVAEQSSETLPERAELSIDIFHAVLQVSHLVFHSDLIFEFTLQEIDETKAHSVFKTALNFTKYNRTLFHFIISPNAP